MSTGYAIFDGSTSKGTFGSTLSFTNTQSLTMEFRSDASDTTQFVLFSNTGNTDEIRLNYLTSSYGISVKIDGTRYSLPANDSQDLFDGEWHTLEVSRSTTQFSLTIDGGTAQTINAVSTAMEIDLLCSDGTNQYQCDLRNEIVIGGETWDLADQSPISSTPGATTLTFTDVIQYSVSEWEWVGELMYMERTVNSYNATRQERRNEGTRSRIVKGIDMGNTIIAEKGDSQASVPAFNAGLESNLVGVANFTSGTADPVCEEERFIPFHGTEFYRQTQRWIAYSFSDS